MEEFGWKDRPRGKRHAVCKECTKVRSNKWYYENKEHHIENVRGREISHRNSARELVLNYLLTHRCVDCGETDPIVLEFDHVQGVKVASVSEMVGQGYSLEKIQAEMEKCVVRCSNCHRRKTTQDRGWFRGKR